MQQYDVHFCLVSGQAAPNLLPILDIQFKPKEAVFIVSKKMKQKAEFLAKTFKDQNVKTTLFELTDEFNFSKMEEELIELVSQYEDKNIALNVTGGTKLISIAAEHAFTLIEKPIFYIDTESNRIVFITKDENKQWLPDLDLKSKNTIKTYLSSYGVSVLKQSDPNEHKQWLDYIDGFITKYQENKNIIPLLNKMASLSKTKGWKYDLEQNELKYSGVTDILTWLDHKNLIDFDGSQVNFRNKATADFLSGGWFENYTYELLSSINKIEDIALGLEAANSKYRQDKKDYDPLNKGHKNEFDVTFMAKNKLHIIECKTMIMDKGDGIKAEDILYKLETLKDYGGLLTKKCLVSYFEVPESVKNRASFLNIEIIQGEDVQRLRLKIQEWIGKNY